ncbi:MAG: glycoside hydrolase family 57 protein [Bacteroidota bacterium]
MRSICLYFQVHQPFRLRTYRFFNIGQDHHYYDDYQNRHIIRRVSEKCYLPANNLMLELIREYGTAFKVSYSISGTALEQLQAHVPEVIDSFRQLADTGQVEFIAETYAHSLASLTNRDEFVNQVEMHAAKIEELFGKRPTTFRNTELIYSDKIGEMVADMGFHTMLTEGAKHILGWKSPNFMYCNRNNPKLKVLLRNFRLSDDLTFRFSNQDWSEWPLTTEKFVNWIEKVDKNEEVVNLFLDYETIGEHQWKETGIFDFFKFLPGTVFSKSNFKFSTPEELYNELQPVAAISVLHPISWADEERDLTAWLGNELQDEAFAKLYSYEPKIRKCKNKQILKDWQYLQTSNHFYYMCTKWFSAGEVHKYFNPYGSPYEAFINYMNVLSDFMIRVDEDAEALEAAKDEVVVTAEKAVPPKTAAKTAKTKSLVAKAPKKEADAKAKVVKPTKKEAKPKTPATVKPKPAGGKKG